MREDQIWELVAHEAAKSPCKKRRVGCIIMSKDLETVLGGGYNYNPTQTDCEQGIDTHSEVKHAEIAAIESWAPGDEQEAIAFVNHEPCITCKQALFNNGVIDIQVNNTALKWPDGPPVDAVHPKHYAAVDGVESIRFFETSCTPEQWIGYLKNTAMKYLYRLDNKDDPLTNARKAKYFVDKLVKALGDGA